MNEDYILHAGVKGMKWGVRRERRAERTRLASEPNASRALTFNQAVTDNWVLQTSYAIKNRSIKEGRKEYAEASRKRNELVKSGEASVSDRIRYYGSTRLEDLIPVKSKNVNLPVKNPTSTGEKAGLIASGALASLAILRAATIGV